MTRDLPICLPRGWRRSGDPGGELIVRGPGSSGRPPPTLRLRRLTLSGEPTSPACQVEALVMSLAGPAVEDHDRFWIGSGEATYVRSVRAGADGDLVVETWAWSVEDRDEVWLLTAEVLLPRYADWCEVFEDVAATFDATRLPSTPARAS